jgi:hypothetical protein
MGDHSADVSRRTQNEIKTEHKKKKIGKLPEDSIDVYAG